MEGSTKPKRPVFQPYVPVHRRNKAPVEQTIVKPAPILPRPSSKDDSEVIRRGRGQFRAPSSDDTFSNGNASTSASSTTKLEKAASASKSSITTPEKAVNSHIEDKPVIELIKKVESLATESNYTKKSEEKDDWEQEWEDNVEEVIMKVKAEPTKKSNHTVKPTLLEDDELTTVLDCYDFPNSFKTLHLQDMFREYESIRGGYSIKWMGDTRALIIFEHPLTAKKAYIDNINSPLIKIRPYKGQIERKSPGPVPRRPATTDIVARRLVHGALGVRSIKTAEQREAEKELLKQAREQRHAQRANTANRLKEIAKAFDE